MRPFGFLLISLLVMLSCNVKEEKSPRRAEVLFLGHNQEHHNSNAYYPFLATALAKDGINFTYTDQLKDINEEYLSLFDAVLIYANHDSRQEGEVKALNEFVESGGALIAVHSASFCFRENQSYIDLVGGQFKKHDTATFVASISNPKHPAMDGFETFTTWDETYVHTNMSSDIEVLLERVEGEHREPWTWVRESGKGRVFYTAYGHDHRTWQNPGFHRLIRNGIVWAIGEGKKSLLESFVSTMPKVEYLDKDNIPNYEKRDPGPRYQLPLSPNESAMLTQVPPGFELSLFASEPNIINPIAMNWDEKGRLWVIETVDYPNTVRADGQVGDDAIKILEDTDGDNRADKVTIFADGLNLPSSFVFVDGGILVAQPPHLLLLQDLDGDDRADSTIVLIDGWGTSDTHAGPSNLQYGLDNQIYGVLGYAGFKGSFFGEQQEFSQGAYRFDYRDEKFEYLSRTSNNTWGLGANENNSIFISTANNEHSVYLGIPDSYFDNVPGIVKSGNKKIDGHYDMKSITPHLRQVDVFGGFTAAAGHHFYTARNYPRRYWNNVAFVCEPTGGVVHMARIKKSGSGYEENDAGNLLASADEWMSPVAAKVGPDGNVWVADWYNFIVQHNPTPTEESGGYDAENGLGNAYLNPLRDRSRGRIWRIVPKTDDPSKTIKLDKNKPQELLKALGHSNMFWRLTAQRLLVDRGAKDVEEELLTLTNQTVLDEFENSTVALHALWTLDGLGLVVPGSPGYQATINALQHPAAPVRKAAIQILPNSLGTDSIVLSAGLLHDLDPTVQMEALLYFSQSEPSCEVGKILYNLSEDSLIRNDHWLSKAAYIAASVHHDCFSQLFHADYPGFGSTTSKVEIFDPAYDDSDWLSMNLPQLIEQAGLDMDGTLWFRRSIHLSGEQSEAGAAISLGPIDDTDIVYINGVKVGATKEQWDQPRVYEIPKGTLRPGENTIAVWVEDIGYGGGFGGTADQMKLKLGNTSVPLHGGWKYQIEDYYSGSRSEFESISIAEKLMMSMSKVEQDPSIEPEVKGRVISIGTVKSEMKYDLTEFTVNRGESITIAFDNNDFMQHNLLIIAPGSIGKVGEAADLLAMSPSGAAQAYVPKLDEVLYATPIVNPGEKVTLSFDAPLIPGEYPFICTFPGHWRIMQGVMKVK